MRVLYSYCNICLSNSPFRYINIQNCDASTAHMLHLRTLQFSLIPTSMTNKKHSRIDPRVLLEFIRYVLTRIVIVENFSFQRFFNINFQFCSEFTRVFAIESHFAIDIALDSVVFLVRLGSALGNIRRMIRVAFAFPVPVPVANCRSR